MVRYFACLLWTLWLLGPQGSARAQAPDCEQGAAGCTPSGSTPTGALASELVSPTFEPSSPASEPASSDSGPASLPSASASPPAVDQGPPPTASRIADPAKAPAKGADAPLPPPELAVAEPVIPTVNNQWIRPGVLAGGLALVPGFVLHGTGHFVIGQRKTARNLLLMEAGGLAGFLGGGALIAVTGSSRRLMGVLAPVTIAGFGLFMLSWMADVYGATTGGRDAQAADWIAPVDAELGYVYVYDPQFSYNSFAYARADLRASALRVTPEAFVALNTDNQRLLVEMAYRLRGRTPRRQAKDGSFADLAMGVRYHRFGPEDFAVITPEWHLDGRLDLGRLGHTLRGSFAEGQLGAAFELYKFEAPGSRVRDNAFGMLLARMGFGVYLGKGAQRTGELLAYYDHRRDDFAAGLGVRGIGGGVLGHFGLSGHYYLTRHWGFSGLFEVGSAYVMGLTLRYRHQGGRG